ncbi:GIY-YIG nuclease family protein [Candidatus Uabimicrobium amorphum]|uniref:UvrABC system protein C n=1 Tax=Uabimicrobium amorphum TaxID=2596890 RepID=A0A5S9ISL1_UABAM|nr:GIY-YIG nuclease family protein [Candidatus Uabimicrobium amorphum]BBM87383.1 UvrABC system protein C [Candidatus Uabimicrobium amorphum]
MKNIRNKLSDIPLTPGVYQFTNKEGNTIYIGKSICLRSRINSYMHKSKSLDSAYEKRRQLLRREMRDVQIHPTPTELLALLLEDKMIKDYLPRYNVRQKKFRSYCYLQLSEGTFPKMEILEDYREGCFGPFKDKFFVENIERFACEHFAFCRCAHTKRKCCYYDMKYCKAPHKYKTAAKKYPQSIAKTIQFLQGQDREIVKKLEKNMHEYAQNLQFEKAEKVKNDYFLAKYMVERHKFCGDFMYRYLVIWENNEYTYTFFQGHLLDFARRHIAQEDLVFPKAKRAERDRFHFDRAGVIFEWIKRQTNVEYCFFTVE